MSHQENIVNDTTPTPIGYQQVITAEKIGTNELYLLNSQEIVT